MPENFLLIEFLHMSSLVAILNANLHCAYTTSAIANANDAHYAEIKFYLRPSAAKQSLLWGIEIL